MHLHEICEVSQNTHNVKENMKYPKCIALYNAWRVK